ncbi:hypothetical protein MKZ38_003727 [Zalerion maritima]|uniref:MRH domain-containing protein n=1 Tax=Zalerion maritima TaxID=339359 RepID=A0AAD5RWN1_9PEZI|nr:hypothetical protein MKZ38_003727 [Zalerion maritima]
MARIVLIDDLDEPTLSSPAPSLYSSGGSVSRKTEYRKPVRSTQSLDEAITQNSTPNGAIGMMDNAVEHLAKPLEMLELGEATTDAVTEARDEEPVVDMIAKAMIRQKGVGRIIKTKDIMDRYPHVALKMAQAHTKTENKVWDSNTPSGAFTSQFLVKLVQRIQMRMLCDNAGALMISQNSAELDPVSLTFAIVAAAGETQNDKFPHSLPHLRFYGYLGLNTLVTTLRRRPDALRNSTPFPITVRSSSLTIANATTMLFHRSSATGAILAVLATAASIVSAEETTTTTSTTTMPCTATSTIGSFFDLSPDTAQVLEQGGTPKHGQLTTDYMAKGYDYHANFTVNICAPAVSQVENVVGVDKDLWRNVSAYYVSDGDVYSLGQESGELKIRGKKLVLQYTGGSPCGVEKKVIDKRNGDVHEGAAYKYTDYANEEFSESDMLDDDGDPIEKTPDTHRRKSMTISFLCDRDPLSEKLAISFVGTDPDECSYFFEARSQHACATAEKHKPGSVGPGSVFAIILAIAVLVYVFGGIFYQRTVAHARGWRQLPNYSLWAGIWSFISDMFVIATSSCAQFLPHRRGYSALSSSANGRNRSREDENRLIDQLDEEWDD